ncbi:MAG TPA: hypothetical protein VNY84_07815 [Acidimicrobiales bacterium]|nr:hypothetical protein [Acidimicrobiales bacterium]
MVFSESGSTATNLVVTYPDYGQARQAGSTALPGGRTGFAASIYVIGLAPSVQGHQPQYVALMRAFVTKVSDPLVPPSTLMTSP